MENMIIFHQIKSHNSKIVYKITLLDDDDWWNQVNEKYINQVDAIFSERKFVLNKRFCQQIKSNTLNYIVVS